MQTARRVFVGVECEGRWRGLPTLFIPRTLLLSGFQFTDGCCGKPHHYLGAGGDRIESDDWVSVRRWIDTHPGVLVTVEAALESAPFIPSWAGTRDVRVILSHRFSLPGTVNTVLRDNVEVKLEDKHTVAFFHPDQVIGLDYCSDAEAT